MQFPYPRKTSHPAPYHPPRTTSLQQRRTLRARLPYIIGGLALLTFIIYLFSSSSSSAPPLSLGTPGAVIVTPLSPDLSPAHKAALVDNRQNYANKHGYATFFPNTTDYDLMPNVPSSWSTIPALRHAMTLYPHTPWLFHLTSTALIMNPRLSLHELILSPPVLEKNMLVDRPVVPPDSVIKTFAHLKGDRVDLVLTQDREGLAGGSFLLRTGDWAKYFLDAWFDPLYRSYNFQKAEGHALEHIVQWHGTVLAKLALVPQRVLNSYTRETGGAADGKSRLLPSRGLFSIT